MRRAQLWRIEAGPHQDRECKCCEEQELELCDHVFERVGMVLHIIGKDIVEEPWENADPDAERRGYSHGNEHVQRCLFRPHAAVMSEEGEEWDLDA